MGNKVGVAVTLTTYAFKKAADYAATSLGYSDAGSLATEGLLDLVWYTGSSIGGAATDFFEPVVKAVDYTYDAANRASSAIFGKSLDEMGAEDQIIKEDNNEWSKSWYDSAMNYMFGTADNPDNILTNEEFKAQTRATLSARIMKRSPKTVMVFEWHMGNIRN